MEDFYRKKSGLRELLKEERIILEPGHLFWGRGREWEGLLLYRLLLSIEG